MAATIEQVESLGAPTPEEEVKQRPIFNKQKVKVGDLDYIDARFVMERLDQSVGSSNWQSLFREVTGGVVGRIGILIDRGDGLAEWVWKEDVGTESTIEATKGSYSDALKRAAVHWGIARDLYDEREADSGRSEAGHRPAAQTTQPTQQAAPAGGNRSIPVPVESAPWVCPEHGGVVAWPAGVSASTGRAYDAFYACPIGRECPHRAPRGLRVKAEHLNPQPQADGDDLPF